MKIKYLLFVTILTFFITQISANEVILKQGNVKVTTDDLDGFAYKLPDDKRIGFFDSPVRVEKTLLSILNMKHIVRYGIKKDLIDDNMINSDTIMRISDLFPIENKTFNLIQENRIKLVTEFIKKEESYIQIQNNITKSIKEESLIELAQEKYLVNKSNYITKETRTIDFLLVVYNQKNKKEQYYKAKAILDLIKQGEATFDELQEKYKNKQVDIETLTLIEFKYDQQNADLSDKLFSNNDIGLYYELIDSNSRFLIANIKKINHAKQLLFEDVKEIILHDLRQNSAEKKFNSLLISLTQKKLEVNEEILATLRSRYK